MSVLGAGRPISGSATGVLDNAQGTLLSASLAAGSGADAVLVLRSGGSGGTVICTINAKQGDYEQRIFVAGVPYAPSLHATLTGAAAAFDVEVG